MKNKFHNNAKKIIALILLGFLAFAFLHSELGVLNLDGDNHGSHDYCEIVKNTKIHSNNFRSESSVKFELAKYFFNHFINNISFNPINILVAVANIHQISKQSTDLYLFNRTLLI